MDERDNVWLGLLALLRVARELGCDEEVAVLLALAEATVLELYEGIAESVADILRAQRGEEVWCG